MADETTPLGSSQDRSSDRLVEYGTIDNGSSVAQFQERFRRIPSRFVCGVVVVVAACASLVLSRTRNAPKGQTYAHSFSSANEKSQKTQFDVLFDHVDRGTYGDPVEGFVNMELFARDLVTSSSDGSASSSPAPTFKFPFPTGAFWTNLVVSSPDARTSYPIVVYPYAYKWSDDKLLFSYPSSHRLERPLFVTDPFVPDLTFYSQEQVTERFITRFDPLSVDLNYQTASGSWKAILVQGSPYVTIDYQSSTPVIKALSIFKEVSCKEYDGNAIGNCKVLEVGREQLVLRGTRFLIKTQEGETYVVFLQNEVDLVYDRIRKTTLTTSQPISGTLRVALVPNGSSGGLARLIKYADSIPLGGKVSWEIEESKSKSSTKETATIRFQYSGVSSPLIMLALPHHRLSESSTSNDLSYSCIKGRMIPVVADASTGWTYKEPLPDLEFDSASIKLPEGAVRSMILEQAQKDLNRVLPTKTENVYGFGKQTARLAQLAHIIDQLGGDDKSKAMKLLLEYLDAFLMGNVSDYLVYDANMGGIVSINGLMNTGEDFGNGRYNDHHFHYGYILYACAVMANLNSTFLGKYGAYVDAIFSDIAHNGQANADVNTLSSLSGDGNGAFFPLARHKSWFDGHSFATGMFSFGDGKSQESSSEAVNCYYGAYLWASVRAKNSGSSSSPSPLSSETVGFARMLLAMEITGAKTYWHMIPSTGNNNGDQSLSVYDADFSKTYMVGNVGMMDVASNTWFGSSPLYVHMINALPITAATAELFTEAYVKEEYEFLAANTGTVEMAWRGYVASIRAIVDPESAWEQAQSIVSYELDSALSKSQVLYWISTRPGFDVEIDDGGNDDEGGSGGSDSGSTDNSQSDGGGSSSCSSHQKCQILGLTGECCPTSSGIVLGCCASGDGDGSSNNGLSASDNNSGSSSGSSSCSSHEKCQSLGLVGNCCPTSGGDFLGCCARTSMPGQTNNTIEWTVQN